MNNHDRILAAMSWEEPDQVPLTTYDWMVPRGTDGRELREMGLGLIYRLPAHRVVHKDVRFHDTEYWEDGKHYCRRVIETPVGEVSRLQQLETPYGSAWTLEHFVKGPDDYRVMEFVYKDAIFLDNLEAIRATQKAVGGDGLLIIRVAKGPIQEILYLMTGMERFSIDFAERRDLIDSLYHVMVKRYDEMYALAAETPAEILQSADNITSIVVGEPRFREYCMTCYERHMKSIAGTGKRLAVHLDGRLASLKGPIGEASFDIVEAFTPAPTGDVTVAEGREAWPDKALWLNFTSSIHIEPTEVIQAHTRQLIEEAGTRRGFAIGITEDIPMQHCARSLRAIAGVIQEMR